MRDARHVPPTFAVVVPTYNHGRTVCAVLDAVAAQVGDVAILVVNDGSTDHTAEVLTAWAEGAPKKIVLAHSSNRGKAAALRTGFLEAQKIGCTHAVTIDSDGQHDPADIPPLLTAARQSPCALILGERPEHVDGCPRASRIGRWISNAVIRLESGLGVRDSQCGLRVYPLALTQRLGGRDRRYGFETSILTRFAWAKLPVTRVPVSCVYNVPGGRISHFRVTRDSLEAVVMHVALVHRALLPGPRVPEREPDLPTGTLFDRFVRWMSPRPMWRKFKTSPAARQRVAASLATGVFIALLPLYGVKTFVCLAAARWLKLEPLAVLGSSSAVSAPPAGPLLALGSIALGSLLIRGRVPELSQYDPRHEGMLNVLADVAVEWTLGGVLLGTALGLAAYVTAKLVLVRRPRGGAAAAEAPAT